MTVRRTVLRGIPFAVLSAGCVTEPWTPSVPVAYWSQPVPDGHVSSGNVYTADLMQRWALPDSDPWARFQKMTLLTSIDDMDPGTKLPDVNALDVVQNARNTARRVGAAGIPQDTMFIVDLRGPASVAFGAELSRASLNPVSLVLTFNNWPAEDEVVPAEETLAALVYDAPRANGSLGGGSPVFLLDAWRLAFRFDEADPGSVDNRYMLSDMPTAEVLAQRGIKNVVYLVESLDDTEVEEDDLNETFLAWQAAGVQIAMMDLGSFDDTPGPYYWRTLFGGRAIHIHPRRLLVHDPHFYVNAHGGFGGIRATPGVAGGHAHWGGGGFHGGGHGGG
jgi:hypothetical protein